MANPRKPVAPVEPPAAPTDVQQAAQARAAVLGNPTQNARMVDALLVERHGYVLRNLPDRVAQVDEQIRLHGGEPPAE